MTRQLQNAAFVLLSFGVFVAAVWALRYVLPGPPFTPHATVVEGPRACAKDGGERADGFVPPAATACWVEGSFSRAGARLK
jgi:hypothetical protein